RTRRDTQLACFTARGAGSKGGVAPVGEGLELAENAQRREVLIADPANLEDLDRADAHAIGLALATSAIDDRLVGAGGLGAVAGHVTRPTPRGSCARRRSESPRRRCSAPPAPGRR